jgi:hypothetical protein
MANLLFSVGWDQTGIDHFGKATSRRRNLLTRDS